MHEIIWIGPKRSAELKNISVVQDVKFSEFETVDTALDAIAHASVAAAIVIADWGDATPTIKKLARMRPEIQIVAATRLGVPMHLGLLLRAGATNVLDLEAKDEQEMGAQIQTAFNRYDRIIKERELLLRLRDLNEDFLRNIVALEERKIELEEKALARESFFSRMDTATPYGVLVIDDEPSMLQLFGYILEGEKYNIVTAEDGESGLNKFRDKRFPLVIVDKNLPGINGLDVMREVKMIEPDTEVMMITGYASKESAIDALNLGASAFLEKPFGDVDVVRAKIEDVVDKQKKKMRRREHLRLIKHRNRTFLDNYRSVRADLEACLSSRSQA